MPTTNLSQPPTWLRRLRICGLLRNCEKPDRHVLKSGIAFNHLASRKSIYITELTLSSFRNYEGLELTLGPGMVLFEGANGQGKSNLLEAIYLLAVAKSPRASTDRELVRLDPESEETYSRVLASVHTGGDPFRVQIDFRSARTGLSQRHGRQAG